MLDFFLREAQQRPQARLVAVDVSGRVLEHHRNDELLDEREQVAVRVGADLVQLEFFLIVEAGDVADPGDAIREKRLREVEIAALIAVFDGPRVRDRAFQTGGVAVLVSEHDDDLSLS